VSDDWQRDWDRRWIEIRKDLNLGDPMERPAFRWKQPGWNELLEALHTNRPAHRPSGSRDRARALVIELVRSHPDLSDAEIVAHGRYVDPERWPTPDDWHGRDAERKRIKRIRSDAADT
jgi:hypothetical protein